MNSLCPPGTSTPGLAFLNWSLALVVACWLFVSVMWNIFERDVFEATGVFLYMFIFPPVRWGFIAVGVILALVSFRQVMSGRENRSSAAAALFLSVTGLVLMFAGRELLSQDVRFLLSKAHYERRLTEVIAGEGTGGADVAEIEHGPPDRVAFYWKRGVTDNWVGLVYDPTGEAGNPGTGADLFGGLMTRSRHLTGFWYLCWFT
jgi:hypothetical protein